MIREQSETVIEALLICGIIAVIFEIGFSIYMQLKDRKK